MTKVDHLTIEVFAQLYNSCWANTMKTMPVGRKLDVCTMYYVVYWPVLYVRTAWYLYGSRQKNHHACHVYSVRYGTRTLQCCMYCAVRTYCIQSYVLWRTCSYVEIIRAIPTHGHFHWSNIRQTTQSLHHNDQLWSNTNNYYYTAVLYTRALRYTVLNTACRQPSIQWLTESQQGLHFREREI